MKPNHRPAAAASDEQPTSSIWPTVSVFGGLFFIAALVLLYVAQELPERDTASITAVEPVDVVPEPPPRPARPFLPPDPARPPKPRLEARPADPKPPAPEEPTRPPEPTPASAVASVESPVAPATTPPLTTAAELESAVPKLPEPPSVDPIDKDFPVVSIDEPAMPSPENGDAPTSTSPGEQEVPQPLPGTGSRVPDKAAIAAKTKEIRLLFKADYTNRDPAARGTLARQLARNASESMHDPAAAYVLATEARDQAIQAGDIQVYSFAGQILSDQFGIDTHDDDIVAFGRLHTQTSRPAEWYWEVFDEVVNRVSLMEARDDFDRAVRYANVAKALALKIADQDMVKEWTARIKDLSTLKTQFASYRSAQAALRDDPADVAANTKWGTYLCLLKGDFEAGVPYLIKGSDPALAGLGKQETNQSRSVADTVSLADAWWEYGEKNKAYRTQARRHAEELYQTVRPQLVGLEATRIAKRLEEQAMESGVPLIVGKTVPQFLAAGPWDVRWERIHGADRIPGGTGTEYVFDETMTFTEDGQVDSRYFSAYVVRRDYIELIGRERDGPPEGGGGPGFQRDLPRRGRAIVAGNELRVMAARSERPDRPDRRGVGTRQVPP